MTKEQSERLIASWEAIAIALGEFNEIARTAIDKQWPSAREPREAVITRLPTAEDRLKKETGNTDGPVDQWLGEFDPEEEIGPRERAFLERKSGINARPKTSS